ncbi:hypothetical protein [Rufibacter sp. LB8]|uniref:hypothetical protein n=1 Tax=Rufibacter sp. LB8 TaxID=2777781 RepID=UPI00178C62CB|nr:hypothetical protein [Rufibacter sp. LB8]
MKKHATLLGLSALLFFSCQSQSSNQVTTQATDTVSTAPVAGAPAGAETSATPSRQEQQREADMLAKDTLNAVQEEIVKKPTASTTQSFAAFFTQFEATIQRQDAAAFNKFIDPQRGLYTIETTGTMPNFYHITDIAKHRLSNFNKPFFTIKELFKGCQLKEVKTWPKINCEGDGDAYAQRGCFLTDGKEFQQQRIHQFASLPDAENQRVEKTLPLVTKSVLHTVSGYKFYFGQIDGQWKVLFINLMTPCSA